MGHVPCPKNLAQFVLNRLPLRVLLNFDRSLLISSSSGQEQGKGNLLPVIGKY
jgi:hypothetical protein